MAVTTTPVKLKGPDALELLEGWSDEEEMDWQPVVKLRRVTSTREKIPDNIPDQLIEECLNDLSDSLD